MTAIRMEIQLSASSTDAFRINSAFEPLLQYNGISSPHSLYSVESESVKKILKERGTSRTFLKDPSGGRDIECYIKRYLKPAIKDRLKCAVSCKPVFGTGALHEWDALCAFHQAGLSTMTPIAACCFEKTTCNLTLGITDYVRASELFRNHLQHDPDRRRRLIVKIAEYAANMHRSGMAHQDFYLVHLFIRPQEDDRVYLIDLQRVIIQKHLAGRWVIKDLAQILFSLRPFVPEPDLDLFKETYRTIRSISPAIWSRAEKKAGCIKAHAEKKRVV